MKEEITNFESEEQLQMVIKKAIQATTNAVFEFISNEHTIVDSFNKSHIPGAALELTGSKSIATYINEELRKVGITCSGK